MGVSRFIPRGVAVAGLGRRFLAALIDAVPPALVAASYGRGAWLLSLDADTLFKHGFE